MADISTGSAVVIRSKPRANAIATGLAARAPLTAAPAVLDGVERNAGIAVAAARYMTGATHSLATFTRRAKLSTFAAIQDIVQIRAIRARMQRHAFDICEVPGAACLAYGGAIVEASPAMGVFIGGHALPEAAFLLWATLNSAGPAILPIDLEVDTRITAEIQAVDAGAFAGSRVLQAESGFAFRALAQAVLALNQGRSAAACAVALACAAVPDLRQRQAWVHTPAVAGHLAVGAAIFNLRPDLVLGAAVTVDAAIGFLAGEAGFLQGVPAVWPLPAAGTADRCARGIRILLTRAARSVAHRRATGVLGLGAG